MSSEIRPEDIEAAIAAAEQRRRARLGAGAELATAATAPSRRPVLPERPVAGATATAEAPAREAARARDMAKTATSTVSDDLDDSWLDQPARPKPAVSRVAGLPESEVVWEPEASRRGLALPFAIAAVALMIFGGILWWAYSSETQPVDGEVPVIVAEDAPIKEKPAEEGGLEVPDQDKLVYDNIADGPETPGQAEQLLPGPEEPVVPPQPAAPVATAPATAQPAPLGVAGQEGETAPGVGAPAAADPALAATPTTPQPQAATAPTSSESQAAAAPTAPEPQAATAPAEPAAPVAAEPPPAPTQQAAAPAASVPAKSAAGGSWKIQLAAVKSEPGARQEWVRLQKVHPDLLGDMKLTVQEVDLGTKGIFFRIQGGPLPDRTTAEDVCAELKATKQACLVVKP